MSGNFIATGLSTMMFGVLCILHATGKMRVDHIVITPGKALLFMFYFSLVTTVVARLQERIDDIEKKNK